MQTEDAPSSHVTSAVSQIVVAYLDKNTIEPDALIELVSSLSLALQGRRNTHSASLGTESNNALPDEVEDPFSALTVLNRTQHNRSLPLGFDAKTTVGRNFITCLECGSSFKALKKHLSSTHKMSAEAYLEKWSLPADYPMVAPANSAMRSASQVRAHHSPKKTTAN